VKIFVVDCSDKDSIAQSNNLLQSLIDDNGKGSINIIDDGDEDDNDKVMHKSRIIIVNNKVDLINNNNNNNNHNNIGHDDDAGITSSTLDIISSSASFQLPLHSISCLTGSGINELEHEITNTILSILAMNSDGGVNSNGGDSDDGGVGSIMITRERHRRHVKVITQR
jgi:tRNA U34 5-carboxymethylaminomethyl modifying GTPase MnmE/TrmE